MKEHEKAVLEKMKVYAAQAIQFKEAMTFAKFSKDIKTISACVFNLSQIGELAGKLSDEFIESTAYIPWRKIKGMRNKIAHDYEGIRLNIVWEVLTDYLPELIDNIKKLLKGN